MFGFYCIHYDNIIIDIMELHALLSVLPARYDPD